MNYRTMVKGALALSLSLTVASAFAASTTYTDVPAYGATFESAVSTIAPLNDYAYELNSGITNQNYRDEQAAKGWFAGSADDESKIIERVVDNVAQQALQLNTDANTLTNKFASNVAGAVNTALANEGTAFFETEVKFVASDTLDAGIAGGQDATKFAIYAYCDETDQENITTNLVVFHAIADENAEGGIGYTNEVFKSVNIDTEVYTKLRIEMKKMTIGEGVEGNVFSVSINGGEPLASALAIDAVIEEKATGTWFLTVEDSTDDDNKEVASLNFKGTGEIDNISVGTIAATTSYDISFVDEDGTTSLFTTNVVAGVVPEFLAETPTKASTDASNFTFAAWSPALYAADKDQTYTATYTATVRSYDIVWVVDGTYTTNSVAYGEVPTYAGTPTKQGYTFTGWDTEPVAVTGTATYTAQFEEEQSGGDDYDAVNGDTVKGEAISAAVAAWLNSIKGNATKEAFEETLDSDQYTLTEEYLLNTDPTKTTVVEFKVTSIAVDDTVDLQVTLTRADNETPVTAAINGELQIVGATSLDGTFGNGVAVDATFEGVTTATKNLTTQAKFFKAVIVEKTAQVGN